jgi:hypothetical protein
MALQVSDNAVWLQVFFANLPGKQSYDIRYTINLALEFCEPKSGYRYALPDVSDVFARGTEYKLE